MALTWTKKEINKFKSHIEKKRVNVVTDLDEARERAEGFTTGDTVNAIYSSHMADAGTDQMEREKLFYFLKRETEYLQYLDRALEMISDGSFGICKSCSEKIAEERLLEVPYTSQCFQCKTNFNPYIPTNVIGNYVRITYCENPGIAFGIQVGQFIHIITLLSILFTAFIIYHLYTLRDKPLMHKTGIALILGGALGNVLDRVLMVLLPSQYSGVVDFIDIGISNSLRWYIFNVADTSITIGIIIYIFYSFYEEKAEKAVEN